MTLSDAAAQTLKEGDPRAALARLQEDIRARPSDAKLRVFLFQLLCILGQWDRALNQLKVASELDPLALPMAQMYGEAVRCEVIRDEVFDGKKSPMVLGEPEQWLALLIEARLRSGRGETAQSEELRQRAFEEAPISGGNIDGRPFEWLADADSRLGPVLEAIINGKYYWVPVSRLLRIEIEKPADLRDFVWAPATLTLETGAASVALIPTRYPGTEREADPALRLARATDWREQPGGAWHGLGQRMLTTDQSEIALLDVRVLVFDVVEDAAGAVAAAGESDPADMSSPANG